MSEPTTDPTPDTPANAAPQGEPDAAADAPPRHVPVAEHAEERKRRQAAETKAADLQKQIDAINQANESAVEKATREANEYKEAAVKATTEALRYRVAAKHNISEERANLLLTGTDEASLEAQAASIADLVADKTTPPGPRPDLTQGGNPGAPSSQEAAANWLQELTRKK